jgi:hypothetical protein
MPWTPKQKRYLLSSGSPLKESQKDKMKTELHNNPSLGHERKTTKVIKKKKSKTFAEALNES